MNNISDKDAIRNKFENWFDVQYGYLKNKKANADIIGIAKEGYQAATESCLSEFEQVAKVDKNLTGQVNIKKANGDYFDMSKYVGENLFTRRLKDE